VDNTHGKTRSTARHCLAALLCAAAGAISAGGAVAAPEEIQVYMDDMSKPHEFGVDLHNNYVFSGSSEPDYIGAQPPRHVYRLTPEFYYGLTDTLELGLYVLTTKPPNGPVNYDGGKLRVKYIAPHDEDKGSFWGLNVEVGKTTPRVSESAWNTELKTIYGYRTGRWTLAFNGNFDWPLSSPSAPVTFEIDSKVAYRTDAGYDVGFESYNELGPVRDMGRLNTLNQTLFAVIDTDLGKYDLNAGIGRGLTTTSDRWLAKFILGLHF
jgi:hypothetical protein